MAEERVAICPGLEDPKCREAAEKALKARLECDVMCYRLLRRFVENVGYISIRARIKDHAPHGDYEEVADSWIERCQAALAVGNVESEDAWYIAYQLLSELHDLHGDETLDDHFAGDYELRSEWMDALFKVLLTRRDANDKFIGAVSGYA